MLCNGGRTKLPTFSMCRTSMNQPTRYYNKRNLQCYVPTNSYLYTTFSSYLVMWNCFNSKPSFLLAACETTLIFPWLASSWSILKALFCLHAQFITFGSDTTCCITAVGPSSPSSECDVCPWVGTHLSVIKWILDDVHPYLYITSSCYLMRDFQFQTVVSSCYMRDNPNVFNIFK